ncbi:TetR/AcrR family transcriptional regulator [Aestuariivirga sp.]|uniref:TetR/AcrR family transcriptional regulator n=1 Tax=Aestuariivirga sp. TaxID=2650926 RepID=UPI00391D8DBB
MSGLRQRQKADRHLRILEAAAGLFREHGYDAVKMEAIAAAAEVSIGTIYNYYRNKGDLLVAIVSLEVEEVLKAGEQVIAEPPDSPEDAVDALIGGYIAHSLHYLSKEMWRQAMAISTSQPDSPFGETYAALDLALARQSCALLAALQQKGLLSREADAARLGEVIFNNTNMNFTVFVKTEKMALGELRSLLRRQHEAVLAGLKP